YFAVWAPNAGEVSVIGDWNYWSASADRLAPRASSGIWEGFVGDARAGHHYKFRIRSRDGYYTVDKADPFGFLFETPPRTASVIHRAAHRFEDQAWMTHRGERMSLKAPMS